MSERLRVDKAGLEYRRERLQNGLTVYLCPDRRFSGSYALYGTDFGSLDRRFREKGSGEWIEVPEGTAHFLEHKLFESPAGDAFDLFSDIGASANAYTSHDRTCYLFSATESFGRALSILLDFVGSPYFTAATVQKEQGIIGQEITMYDDHPGWQTSMALMNCLYERHPLREDIAGTVATIARITDRTLYSCYEHFYNPRNMALVLCGNFDADEALEVIERECKLAPARDAERDYPAEPDKIVSNRGGKKLSLELPMFSIGFKEIPAEPENRLRETLLCELLLELIFADWSPLFCALYEEALLTAPLSTEVVALRGALCNAIEGESKDPEEVNRRALKFIEDLRARGISEAEFRRAQKSVYGQYVRSFSGNEAAARALLGAHFDNYAPNELFDTLSALTAADLNDGLARRLRGSHAALAVISPSN